MNKPANPAVPARSPHAAQCPTHFGPELVEKAVAEVRQDELSNARAIWRKKYKEGPKSREEWAKQARFLQSRGFSFELIKKILNDDPDETI